MYCWKCIRCGNKMETLERSIEPPFCNCDSPRPIMKRDYRAEGVANTFRPTVDQYAKKKGF